MNTSTITPQIASFAEAVRDALSDLTETEREELTEGLEADLAEAYAEDLARELPDPVEYATELRTAAGLPAREESVDRGRLAGLRDGVKSVQRAAAEVLDQNPALQGFAALVKDLRPVWWVARAWVTYWFAAAVFGSEGGVTPTSGFWWAVLVGLVVVSVQWGRGRWQFPGSPAVIGFGNVAAAVLAIPAVGMATTYNPGEGFDEAYYQGYAEAETAYLDAGVGVQLDGVQVSNIFAYGADGKPLTDVQLFTETGEPLRTTVEGADACVDDDCMFTGTWITRAVETGGTARNVFPLVIQPLQHQDADGNIIDGGTPQRMRLPFATVGPVVPLKAADAPAPTENPDQIENPEQQEFVEGTQ